MLIHAEDQTPFHATTSLSPVLGRCLPETVVFLDSVLSPILRRSPPKRLWDMSPVSPQPGQGQLHEQVQLDPDSLRFPPGDSGGLISVCLYAFASSDSAVPGSLCSCVIPAQEEKRVEQHSPQHTDLMSVFLLLLACDLLPRKRALLGFSSLQPATLSISIAALNAVCLKWYIPPPLCPPLPAASSITALPFILTFSLRTILRPVSVSLKAQLSVFYLLRQHKLITKARRNKGRTEEGHPKHQRDKNTPYTLTVRMESKAKSSVKPGTKTEKKDAAPPPKPNPAPAEPEVEKPAQDGNQEGAQEENEAAGCSCETLEHLKPFLIGGAVVALGAVLVGLVLLARKK
ncbi:uncharacterized protein LOC131360267 [Hemibagrus wyckioides]|uniref:uncharacterized protein LOC131360267 n=1 Tax=Hemibagrus wyckioides TaxID=337641 RepID=UPI00266C75DF|nr:uncharacterized protein LOC131360267 [Hemibagrus wyckioides]